MKRLQKAAVIIALADELRERKNWCGETHLQKTVYFLQELAQVPLGFDFILYKHGPFSFDLRDELTAMRADGLLALKANQYPYGPSLITTEGSARLKARFPETIDKYKAKINFIADQVGDKGVSELESLATALYVKINEANHKLSEKEISVKIIQIKPHINNEDAFEASDKAMKMSNEIAAIL